MTQTFGDETMIGAILGGLITYESGIPMIDPGTNPKELNA